MMVDYGPGPITHYEDCWRSRSHWRCAVARVEALERELAECREKLEAPERELVQRYKEHQEECLRLERELTERENNFTQALKASADVVKKLERDSDAMLEQARDEGHAVGFRQGVKKANEWQAKELEQTRAAERERCCKAVCEWCADDEPLRLIETQWLHSVDPFVEYWSWEYVRKCDAQAIREEADDGD